MQVSFFYILVLLCVSGDPSVLVRLIHNDRLRLDEPEVLTEDELKMMLDHCGANITQGSTKVCFHGYEG